MVKQCKCCGASKQDGLMRWWRGRSGVCIDCLNRMPEDEFRSLLVMEADEDDDIDSLNAFRKMGYC